MSIVALNSSLASKTRGPRAKTGTRTRSRAERRARGGTTYWRYFEHLACLATVVDKPKLIAGQRLLSVDKLEPERRAAIRATATRSAAVAE